MIISIQTAFLITALAIVVNERVVNAQNANSADQMSMETKNKAVTIVEGPRLNKPIQPTQLAKTNQTHSPELRPSSKPPLHLIPDKKFFYDMPQHFYNSMQKLHAPPLHLYTKEPLKLSNSVYKFPNVIPIQRGNLFYPKPTRQPLIFAASTGNPLVAKSPKFSLPVQTINGIRTDFVRPPKVANLTTSTSTTIAPTTTQRILRTRRIWPKRIIEKINSTSSQNISFSSEKLLKNDTTNSTDLATSGSRLRTRYAATETPISSTTSQTTTRGYRRVTRTSRIKPTKAPVFEPIQQNDWIPIVPSHYSKQKKKPQTPIGKRSDVFLQPYGLLPFGQSLQNPHALAKKKMVFFHKRKRQNPYVFTQEYNPKVIYPQQQIIYDDQQTEGSQNQQKVLTKIKHHHHHHHHRYIKTVEKPVKVPYKVEVEVPKPYPVEKKVPVPVPVEKIKVVDRPYPVQVEKKVPYPVTVKVPHPVPVKVVEKEYVPKPYAIVHHVPIFKQVEVKVPQPVAVQVEKRVPYPVKVPYAVEKRVPVPVETKVPYPVPVKVFVPQPYPVEKKVPYPVEVKVREPVEVIRHVHVKVPYPQPYPVKIPHPIPYTVEKRVPYPVKVEKKVPYPVEVLVPQKVEVEKRVPVYVPRPYPVEKRVPYPVKVPYPVRVPVKVPVRVPVEVPVYIHHPFQIINDDAMGVGDGGNNYYPASESNYYADGEENGYVSRSETENVTNSPQHTVTVHGNTGFTGFVSRSDSESTTAKTTPTK